MKTLHYDPIQQQQLKTKVPIAAELANKILEGIDNLFAPNEIDTPLENYYNLCLLLDQVDEIYHQLHIAALDYIRVKETKDFSAISNNDIEVESKKTPYVTKDGVQYQWVRVAHFRNLATKDSVLNSLLLNEKAAMTSLKRVQDKITQRITTLRAMPEFKKAKPTKVQEVINIRYDK